MSKRLLTQQVATMYGDRQTLTGASLKDGFGCGDLSWVFAYPPSFSTLVELLRRSQQDTKRHITH